MTEITAEKNKTSFTDSWYSLLFTCTKIQEMLIRELLNLKYDIDRNRSRSYIRSVSSRLKSLESIQEKLQRLNLEVTPEAAKENLHDIVGLRLVCAYLSDIDIIVRILNKNPNFTIVDVKNYISSPKPSGYRSMHVIVEVPWEGDHIQCEIQLRTTAMDGWAALEHQMRYKKNKDVPDVLNNMLYEVSEQLYSAEISMSFVHTMLSQDDEPFFTDDDDIDDAIPLVSRVWHEPAAEIPEEKLFLCDEKGCHEIKQDKPAYAGTAPETAVPAYSKSSGKIRYS